jgi:UrcA family protein
MPLPISPKRLALAALAAIGFAAAGATPAVHAQPGYEYGSGGEITVYGPRHVQRDPATGAEIDVARASRTVYYGDLDLSAPWGMRALHGRLERAAASACNQLLEDPTLTIIDSNTDCVGPAVRDAMYRVGAPDYRYGYGD